jgi:parallel beta-helix repeat protein
MKRGGSASRIRCLLLTTILVVSAILLVVGPAAAHAASFTVDSTADRPDSSIGDGSCESSVGTCTVRAAIQEGNSLAGADTIHLPAGVYELEIPTFNEDLDETGDYDIHDSLTIVGEGPAASILDGGWPLAGSPLEEPGLDRLIEIHPTAGNVSLSNLTLREGFSEDDGGAIQNWSSGLLRLENVHVLDNLATGAGGGINNADAVSFPWLVPDPLHVVRPGGRVELINSTFSGNGADGGGAALNNESKGTIAILDGSRIVDNPGLMIPDPANPPEPIPDPKDPTKMIPGPVNPFEFIPAPGVFEPDSSPITNEGAFDGIGTIRVADSTIARNYSHNNGAGIVNEGDGSVIVERSTIKDNITPAGGGGIYSVGGELTVTDSTVSGNLAHDGGGIYSGGASTSIGLRSHTSIVDSTIKDNFVEASGGGMISDGDGEVTMTDVTFSGNHAGDGGGGLNNGGRASLELTRVTFSGNQTHGEGGGAYTGSERLVTIEDSSFTGNHAGTPEPEEALADPSSVNIAGGGGIYTEGGPTEIAGTTFEKNTASDEGGGLSIDNFGDVRVSNSTLRENRAGTDGGGVENSGFRVTFDELVVTGNRADLDGGGIYNSSSGEFTVLDTTVSGNSGQDGGGLANAPDNDMIVRSSLFLKNTARPPHMTADGDVEEGGHGGGIFSLADGDAFIENTTLSGNKAFTGGGGLFHDADGELKLNQLTIWRNSAPRGGGIGVAESDFVPEVPPKPNVAVIIRNTIVGGSLEGGSCDWFVTSEGGNIDTGGTQSAMSATGAAVLPGSTACFLSIPMNSDSGEIPLRDRRGDPALDAIADNGGPTLTHAPRYGSFAIDGGVGPCPETDQRGVRRPQNGRCDSGAYEFEGPPPPPDDVAPDTQYISGPIQDSLETVAFRFTGSDDKTPVNELQYECRLVEVELTEEEEPIAPWEPVPPELQWQGCISPWQAPLTEEGMFTFEVRAIDRADNTDPTPDVYTFGGDVNPPDTVIVEKPANPSTGRSATFTFEGIDNMTPTQFMEFECRIDSRDPEMWLECYNPVFFSNLTTGEHTVEVRAYDGAEMADPTPARYKWTVGQPADCDQANITLTAAADGFVDQVNPLENYLFEMGLVVRSGAVGDPEAVPPEPVKGENARALVRFGIPTDAAACELESAKLRLYTDSGELGRTLTATPLGGPWKESTLNWSNQPGLLPGASAATTGSGEHGYRDWDVTGHVQAVLDGAAPDHGWSIRDAHENDPEGGEQEFASRELPQDPPEQTLPLLVLKYGAAPTPPPPPPTLPPNVQPTEVHCGQVLTESTLVGNDLENCFGEGLVVGASNIVVDLNGHTIDGPDYLLGNLTGQEEGFPPGIRVSGKTNVIVRNGTVQEFGYGVMLTAGTTRTVVEGLTVLRNAMSGIELFDADDGRNGNTVRNNTINENELGITLLGGAENSLVKNNSLRGNLGEQILVQFSDGHLIEGNDVIGIPIDPNLDSDGGIMLEGSSNNVLRNNVSHDTGDAAVVIHMGSNDNRVEGGALYRNGDAGVIIQDSDRNQVINVIAHQGSDGGVVVNNGNGTVIRDSDLRFNPSGVEASNSNNLLIEGNDASDSLQTGLEIGNGVGIRILDNVANRTGGAGIGMEGGAFDELGNAVGGALIEGNTANENLESGISVADGGHTIRGNNAYNNAGFGILAGEAPEAPGEPPSGTNIDGGGNKAAGNSEPEQCVGVVCDSSGPIPPLTPEDLEEPVATILTHPTDPSGDTTATFTFTATDNHTPPTGMVFECRLDNPPDPPPEPIEAEWPPEPPDPNEPPDIVEPIDGVGWAECISPVVFQGLELGPHHFEVRALDQHDNRDLTPATYDWNVDLTFVEEGTGPDSMEPETRIASGPSGGTLSTTASFRFAGSDNLTPGLSLTFECSLDGASFTPCTTPRDLTGLSVGSHTFEVRAIDIKGNVDSTPASRTWTVVAPPKDEEAPNTSIDSGPDPTTVQTAAKFTFSSEDPTATFECSLNDAPFQACTSPKEYTGLPTGDREFKVRAVDPAGNADPSPARYLWFIGSTPVPGHVFCNQVITKSIAVQNDLVDCVWDGLVVGANGVTIDLNGHTIDGKGIAAGIRNDGFDNVTIKNGRVTDFDYGVMLNPGSERNIVEAMKSEHNQEAGIALGKVPHPRDPLAPMPSEEPLPTFQSGVNGSILRNNEVIGNAIGVWLTNGTKESLIHHNSLAANDKEGIWIERSTANRVESNEITLSNGAGVALQGSGNNTVVTNDLSENDAGVLIDVTRTGTVGMPSNGNRVEGNRIFESGEAGIEVIESNGNILVGNTAHFANGDGISLYKARDTLVEDNDVRTNKGGISLNNSSGNHLESNDASESMGTGISLEALSIDNVILDNDSSSNDGDGIYAGDETSSGSGMWIEGNRTNNNKGYGIFVPKVSHTIKGNIANDNGGWGIWVSDGSNGRVNIDGGGNKAQGNLGPLDPLTLKPLQCFSVKCDGGPAPKTDPIAPTTTITEAPDNPSTGGVETFRFDGNDNASTIEFQCSLDGASFGPCTSPAEYTLPFGSHTFEVRAVDLSGNVDLTPAQHTWWIDPPPVGVPPVATIDSGPDHTTVERDAQFEFSANERGATLECALDEAGFQPCASPKSYTDLAVGNHSFSVRATDVESNTDTATWTWAVQGPPVPAEVTCGEIVVQSTRLTNDIVNCPGHGLIIGTGGITIDLDGHFIDGTGLEAGIMNPSFDNVTITNGTVHEFDHGVLLGPGTGRNIVTSIRAEGNQEGGIALADADQAGQGNTIRGNTVILNGFGIALYSGTKNALLRNNHLANNQKEAVLLEHATAATVEDNEITSVGGGKGIVALGGGDHVFTGNTLENTGGIAIGEELMPTNNVRVEDNLITESLLGGITVVGSDNAVILHNTVRDANGSGVALELARNTLVRGNDLRSNKGGIELSESSGNRIEANNASGTLGAGIDIGDISYDNTVIDNSASTNAGDGIAVDGAAPFGQGNLLEANTADGNGGDGIAIEGVGHILKDNSAQVNGGWGMYAAVGVTDRGGNHAAGNMEPAQCYNVKCIEGEVPGAPETWILDRPAAISNSRNASFTYMAEDDVTPLHELVFECRIDASDDPFAWEDCDYPAELLNLSPGQHTFEVRAIDKLGAGMPDGSPAKYTWSYQPLPVNDPPESFIDMKPEAVTWIPEAIFTFHSNEPDVTFECKVDQWAYEPCGFEMAKFMQTGGYEAAIDEEEVGPHTFYVRAIDFEGHVGEPATYTWSLLGVVTRFTAGPGFTPPETPMEQPEGGPTLSADATIDFQANVADATYECSLDLEPFAACEPPVKYTGLSQGEHQLRVIATSGEMEEIEPAEYEWEVLEFSDTSPPETTIERAPANNSSSTTFEFAGSDDQTPPDWLEFECRLDSKNELDWQACTNPYNLLDFYTYEEPEMAPGQHTFEVRARDLAEPEIEDPNNPNFDGNVDPTPATHTWTMTADTTPPGTGISKAPATKIGPEPEADLVEFFGNDNATPLLKLTFECSLDEEPFAPCESPESIGGQEPGEHTLRIRAVDLAGNFDPTPATHKWEVVSAPDTKITSGPAGRVVDGGAFVPPSTSESAVFVFSADQAGSKFECSLDGADFLPCSSPSAFWVVENGSHEFVVQATNPEGVVEAEPATYEWNVELGPDVVRPNTTITKGPPTPDESETARFEFNGSDNRTPAAELSFECAIDGTAFSSCTSPEEYSDLTRGKHVLLVRARDGAGNFDGTPARHEWVVEQPPVSTILSGPEELTESSNATFTFAADVPGSSFKCWLDGLLEPCTSPVSYSGLEHGEHIFAVLARAPAGTSEQQWVEYEWTVGYTKPPIATIHSGPDIESEDPRATFVFSANQPNVEFFCSIDGAQPHQCSSPMSIARTSLGEHRFEVYADHPPIFDRMGELIEPLYEPVVSTYEWTTVDNIPPNTQIRYGPPAQTASNEAYFGFGSDEPAAEIECSLDFEGFSDCDAPFVVEELLPGEHTLLARAVDLAGNVDPTPVVHKWTVTRPANNTPTGNNVTVNLPVPSPPGGNATVNFFEVNLAGITTLDPMSGAPALPPGYTQSGGRYYDISTTAEFGEPVKLCIPYEPAAFDGSTARLLEFDGSTWLDITISNNPSTGVLCGEPQDFTIFAIAASNGANPLASIISGPPLVSESGTATFEFIVDNPDAPVQCSLDGLPFESCSSPKTYTHLEEGDHSFVVQALNMSGLPPLTPPIPYEWEVVLGPDTSAPDTRIVKGPPALTANYEVGFEFTGIDDQTLGIELEFECLLDGVLLGSCSSVLSEPGIPGSPYVVETEAPGRHTFEVRAMDEMGNKDPTPAVRSWTVTNLTAPDTSIEFGPEEESEGTVAMFEFIGQEELTDAPVFDFECSLDGEDFRPCTNPHLVENLTLGPHTMQVRAVGAGGMVDLTPDIYEWLVLPPLGLAPPDTFIVSAPDVSGPDAIFGFQSDQLTEEFECAIDAEPFSGCDAALELQGLAAGQHTIRVRAKTAITEVADPSPASHTWTVVGEPETTILSGPPEITSSRTATFNFYSDQPGATFRCSIDGSPPTPCTSPYVAGPLATETEHSFEVWAVNEFRYLDGERVMDLTPAEYEWLVQDTEPPDTTINSVVVLGPTDLIEPDSIRFELTGEDNGTPWWELEFECLLDGGEWEGCDRPFHHIPLEDLAGGPHELLVRATDEFENVDPTPASHKFDTEGNPETTIVSGPAEEIGGHEATFTFSSDLPGATFQCSLDGVMPFTACSSPVTFTDVPWGEHELEVRAKGPLGAIDLSPETYSWTSGDMTPPVVTITGGPAVATTDTTASFTFTIDDPDASAQCSLDGGPLTFCQSPVQYTGLLAGEHTLEITPTKQHLLAESVAATWTWTVDDEVAPETAVETGPAAEIPLGMPAVFKFSSNEPDATFECALDPVGVPQFSQCAGPPQNKAEFTGLEAGEHKLLVRAVDPSLNTDASAETYTFTVVGPAATTIESGPPTEPATTTEIEATFTFSANQGEVSYECMIDGEGWAPCSSPVTYKNLSFGDHLFEVRTTNKYDLVEEPAASREWTIALPPDATPPETTLETFPEGISAETSAAFTFFADQAGSSFRCSLDNAAFEPCSSPETFHGLAEGLHKLEVRAVNTFGTPDPTPELHEWTVDLLPETFIDSHPANPSMSTTALFDFSSNEGGQVAFECALDTEAFNSCAASMEYTELTTGAHKLLVRARDLSGNVDPTPASFSWTVGGPPETIILSGPEDPTEERSATFTFTSNRPGVSFECALDEAVENLFFQPCSSPLTYNDLIFGEHALMVRAVDAAGTVDPTPAEFEWEIGGIPPAVTIESGPDATSESRSASFVFSAPGSNLLYECSLNGGAFSPCAPPKSYGGLPLGPNKFEVRVFDPEAVVEGPVTTHEWIVTESVPPDTEITFGPPPVTGTAAGEAFVAFGFASDDPLATFECALDGEAFNECESPHQYSDLEIGDHIFRVRAVDRALNKDASPATYSWKVAATPETFIDIGPENVVTTPTSSFSFSSTITGSTFECSVDLGPYEPCSASQEFSGLADGEHTLEVRARSPQGIVDETPEEWSWTIEAGPPDTTVISGPPASTPSRSASFTFTSNEPEVEFECSLDGAPFLGCESESEFFQHTALELTLGEHTLRVRALDNEGFFDTTPASYTWTVVPAPETTIDSGPADMSPATTASISFSGSKPNSTFECRLDGAAWSSCTSPAEYSELTVDWHLFEVRSTDADGNVEVWPASHGWNVVPPPETIPPVTTIDSGPPASTNSTNATFRMSASELGVTYECSLDGNPFLGCEPPVSYTELAVGPHEFRVQATDAAGNLETTPVSYSWTVTSGDSTPPETLITAAPPVESATSDSAQFSFVSSEAGSSFECSLNGAAFAACPSPITYESLPAGDLTFMVRAVDAEGNRDPSPASYLWTVEDTTPPNTEIIESPADPSGANVSFGFTGTDNPVFPAGEEGTQLEFECRLDSQGDGAWVPCTGGMAYKDLNAGEHSFEVRAMDEEGNVDPTPAAYSWTVEAQIDSTPPQTTIDSGPSATTQGTSASFTFSASEPGSSFECALDGVAFEPCESPREYTGLDVGGHELRVRAKDAAGNVDESPASFSWTVLPPPDTTAPETTIHSGPSGLTASTEATFAFTASEPGSSFECALDGDSFSSCSSPRTYSGLSVGGHEVKVRAKDIAGNVEETPATHGWTVMAPPETTIDSGPAEETESTEATFTFSADQAGSSFECAFDGALFAPCGSSESFSGLALGDHDLEVRAKGPAGNVDQSPAQFSWVIGDLIPPVVTIESGPDGITTADTSATFTITVDDPEAVLQCSLDGAPLSVCISPKTYTGLLAGEHSFEVTALKQHLLVDAEPVMREWTVVDETAPETTIENGPPAEILLGDVAKFAFSSNEPDAVFECALDTAEGAEPEFSACASPPQNSAEFSGLEGGRHELLVRAVDPSENADETPESYAWTVIGPPTTTITGPANPTEATTAKFEFSANQAGSTFVCSLDGAAFEPCTSPVERSGLAEGPHEFEVRATNTHSMVEEPPALHEWTIAFPPDTVDPETTILSAPLATTTNTSASFEFGGSDNRTAAADLTFECALDEAAFVACPATHEITGLSVGAHQLDVRAIDQAGNVDGTPAHRDWTVEAPVPPNTPVGSEVTVELPMPEPPGGTATATFSTVTATGTTVVAVPDTSPPLPDGYLALGASLYDINTTAEFGAPVTVCLPQGAVPDPARLLHFENGAWVDVTLTVDGSGRLCGQVAGLSPFAVATATAAAVPGTTILSGPPASTPNTTARFELASDDPLATFECALDDPVDFGSCASVQQYEVLIGSHELLVRARNEAGRLDATPAKHLWTVRAPETTIDSGPEDGTLSTVASFVFSSDDANPEASFECSLDGELFGSCLSPHEEQGLAPGDHELRVRAVNGAGEFDPTPASHQWNIEALPETTIDSGPDELTESRSATFAFSSSKPGSTFECALDDAAASGSFEPCDSPKTYESLVFGEHDFIVRAVDAGGHADPTPAEFSWEIGGVPPPVTIESAPDSPTESKSATFVFSAEGRSLAYECSRDGGAFSPCTSPRTYNGLPFGPHTFRVRVLDEDAVTEAPIATHEWTVADLTAPETTIDFGPAATTPNTTANFAFSSDDAAATFECSLDGAPFSLCPAPSRYEGLAVGERNLRVRAVDLAGNADPTPASHDWTIEGDTTPPETTIHAKPPAATPLTEATFSFSADEGGATFECALDAQPFAACEAPVEYTDLAIGEHRFRVRALDAEGNADATPAEHTWTVEADTTPPDTVIVFGPPETTAENFAIFSLLASEPEATFECNLDGEGFEECLATFQITELTPGEHTLEVAAVDRAENADPTPATYAWTVEGDTTGPETTIQTGPAATTTNTRANFTFFASDPEAELECSLDGGPFESCSSPEELEELAGGDHVFRVRATDGLGNVEAEPASWSWTILGPPQTTIDSGPAEEAVSGEATFEFSASEPDATFECRIDFKAFGPCESPKTYTGLADGDHMFEVRAVGANGLRDETPAEHAWTTAVPPNTTIVSGPDATTSSRSAGFAFTSSEPIEPGAGFECSLDGGAFSECTTPHLVTDLGLGLHELRVQAVDIDGNVDPTPASYTWTVVEPPDTAAPETTISAAPSSGESQSASFSFSASEPSTYQCSLDGAAFAPCGSPKSYADLAVGSHEFRVRAIDSAGNVDASPASHAWTISPPPPPPPPPPPEPTCTASTATLSANADSWVLQSSASQNYGTDSVLKVDTKSATNARALVRFNLPSIPAGCTVTSAKLRLHAGSYKEGRTLKAHRLASAWTESNVRWSNQPATAGAAATATSGSGYREWSVTSQVQSMYVDGNFGFIVRDGTEDATGFEQAFHSREKKEFPPRLVLTFG